MLRQLFWSLKESCLLARPFAIEQIRFAKTQRKIPTPKAEVPEALLPTVVIVGRPNVGKSALFNKLVRLEAALVYDTPDDHVTRDYKEMRARLGDLQFKAIDTSGLEPQLGAETVQGRATEITTRVLSDAELALFVVDSRHGLLPQDVYIAKWLLNFKRADQILPVANKSENQQARIGLCDTVNDCWSLGLGEPTAISCASGEGFTDLYATMQPYIDHLVLLRRQKLAAAALAEAKLERRLKKQRAAEKKQQEAANLTARIGPEYDRAAAAATTSAQSEILTARESYEGEEDDEGEDDDDDLASYDDVEGGGEVAEAGDGEEIEEEDDEEEEGEEIKLDESLSQGSPAGDAEKPATSGKAGTLSSQFKSTRTTNMLHLEAGKETEDFIEYIKVAIMGLPNVGKSTLMNSIINERRSLTGPEPGLTRDTVSVIWKYKDRNIQFMDTAGVMREQAYSHFDSVGGGVAALSTRARHQTLSAVHVVMMVTSVQDAVLRQRVLSDRELKILGQAIEEGKALILLPNKMDTLAPHARDEYLKTMEKSLRHHFKQAGEVPIIPLAALFDRGVEKLAPQIVKIYDSWNRRLSTCRLNRFLRKLEVRMIGSGMDKKLQRIKYLVQIKARPPTFVCAANGKDLIEDGVATFVAAQLREAFDMHGVPFRVKFMYKKTWKERLEDLSMEAAAQAEARGAARKKLLEEWRAKVRVETAREAAVPDPPTAAAVAEKSRRSSLFVTAKDGKLPTELSEPARQALAEIGLSTEVRWVDDEFDDEQIDYSNMRVGGLYRGPKEVQKPPFYVKERKELGNKARALLRMKHKPKAGLVHAVPNLQQMIKQAKNRRQ